LATAVAGISSFWLLACWLSRLRFENEEQLIVHGKSGNKKNETEPEPKQFARDPASRYHHHYHQQNKYILFAYDDDDNHRKMGVVSNGYIIS
jgi:hypothetical protein